MVGFAGQAWGRRRTPGAIMLQISENAGQLIKKMTARHGLPGGGLRIGIKAGGCSGFSYTFAWEAAAREGVHRSQEPPPDRRHHAGLRHQPGQPRLHLQ